MSILRLAFAAFAVAAAPVLAEVQTVNAQTCLSCHSVDGVAHIDHVPIIHGQSETYLRNALHAYKSGQRSGGTADVMQAVAQDLSAAQIDQLAAFFGTDASIVQTAPISHLIKASAEGADGRLVYLTTKEGSARVVESRFNGDYFRVAPYVESEKFLTFCSIATMAAVLNSFEDALKRPIDTARYPYPYFTQDNIFNEDNQQVKTFEGVVTDGLTLDQIGLFLTHLDVRPSTIFADENSIEHMRNAIMEGLSDPAVRVILNYNRGIVGQNGSGHVSPIAAYHQPSDSVLVLDVAGYKYPPAWIPMDMLYKAMLDVDTSSKRSRGLALVRTF
ncbi:phytochelatin synthase family protein [Marinovum sp. 2_MG-2023]|uniref:phytochelatin synthase family protein n=1 Tax=unclassified Marinovum TaxID=2647166 RepID=UPI0026E43B44|nr:MULTISPECIES: phytochelatin synthase family protein [unclassified Marinovum]MDO6729912.1 phytochelatin synthase family protein [Marinovum sp. 2_MG-2023]MDO6779726.1 phytochelatin synthase family protein [Marinovum sp. 1_MG-2023]